MAGAEVVAWLLSGDVAVQFQATRDLLHRSDPELQARIATEGRGGALLSAKGSDGHWGRGFYQPKWTSSHYTLLELRNLGVSPQNPSARDTVTLILDTEKGRDGGLNPSRTLKQSDACVNGMALNYGSYFGADEQQLVSIVDSCCDGSCPTEGSTAERIERMPTTRRSTRRSPSSRA